MGDLAAIVVPVAFFVTIAAIAILRPLSKRLGDLIEMTRQERQAARLDQSDFSRLGQQLEQLHSRLDLLEHRVDFAERLLDERPAKHLAEGADRATDLAASRSDPARRPG